MSKFGRPSPEEVREAIRSYLHNHPEIDGIKGLSESTGISYHSLQKYAKGSNTPPRDKWEILARVIEYSALGPESTKPGLFFSRLDDQKMASKNPDHNDLTENSSLEAAEPTQASAKAAAASESHKINGSPELFSDLTTDDDNWSHAKDRQEVFLPVSGFTWYYPEEVEIIDHPAFQRLSGINQLGMTHLVYRGATHRRIEHSLGAVGIAQRMLEAATHNCRKRNHTLPDSKDRWLLGLPPTKFERRFIRLGALLHDIGHVAYGHTIEDELRLLNKHDDDERVDKIFNGTTWHNSEVKSLGETIDEQYQRFMPKALTSYQPSDILKRIVLKPPKDATDAQKSEDKVFQNQCAAAGLRISICRDIVGNTICADLLDYLHRDWYHLGKPRYFDERILHYMEIRTPESNKPISQDKYPDPTAERLRDFHR